MFLTLIHKKKYFETYPFIDRYERKKSFAASLIAFSGVTNVRFTAAPVI